MAFKEVWKVVRTIEYSGPKALDYLGNPIKNTAMYGPRLTSDGFFYPGIAFPDLDFFSGTATYTETWEADGLIETPSTFSTSTQGTFGGSAYFPVGLMTGAGWTGIPFQEYMIAPRAPTLRTTIVATTPAGTYNYSHTHNSPSSLLKALPISGKLFGAAEWVSVNNGGVLVPGTPYTWQAHTVNYKEEWWDWGVQPNTPAFSEQIDGVTSGRYVKIIAGGGSLEQEYSTGDPNAGGAGFDPLRLWYTFDWLDAWKYRFRFDMVDHLGNPVSRRVLFSTGFRYDQSASDQNHIVVRNGSFDETIERDTQMIGREIIRLGPGVDMTEDDGPETGLLYPSAIGVQIPHSTLKEVSPPADPINIQWNDTDRHYKQVSPPAFARYPFYVPVKGPPVWDFDSYKWSLPQTKIWSVQPASWFTSIPGGSVAGNTLTATDSQPILFTAILPVGQNNYGYLYPYRYARFAYTAEKDGFMDVQLGQPAGYMKEYRIPIKAGSHIAEVDTVNPRRTIQGTGAPWTDAGLLPRVDGQNVIVSQPLQFSNGRFGGIVVCTTIWLSFIDNKITVSNFGGFVKYSAKARQMVPSYSNDPFVLSDANSGTSGIGGNFYNFVGHVDGKDAHRFYIPPGNIAPPTTGNTQNYNWQTLTGYMPGQQFGATQRDGSLYPEQDALTEVVYKHGTYGTGAGTFPNVQHSGLYGNLPFFHASVFWGTAISTTTLRKGKAEIVNQTVDDGASFNEEITINTQQNQGWGLMPLDWWWSPLANALNWTGQAPADSQWHFRIRDKKDELPYDWRRRVGTESFGSVYWVGMLGSSIGGNDVHLNLTRRHSFIYEVRCSEDGLTLTRFNLEGDVEEHSVLSDPDIARAQVAVQSDDSVRIAYELDSKIYLIESDSNGETWKESIEIMDGENPAIAEDVDWKISYMAVNVDGAFVCMRQVDTEPWEEAGEIMAIADGRPGLEVLNDAAHTLVFSVDDNGTMRRTTSNSQGETWRELVL